MAKLSRLDNASRCRLHLSQLAHTHVQAYTLACYLNFSNTMCTNSHPKNDATNHRANVAPCPSRCHTCHENVFSGCPVNRAVSSRIRNSMSHDSHTIDHAFHFTATHPPCTYSPVTASTHAGMRALHPA